MIELGRKVFVSYKYRDNDVKKIPNVTQPTWPCDYVDYIKNKILSSDDITIFYKGIMPSEKILDLPVDCNTLTGSVNL